MGSASSEYIHVSMNLSHGLSASLGVKGIVNPEMNIVIKPPFCQQQQQQKMYH